MYRAQAAPMCQQCCRRNYTLELRRRGAACLTAPALLGRFVKLRRPLNTCCMAVWRQLSIAPVQPPTKHSYRGRPASRMGLKKIVIRGARQHNLKNISLEIPRNTLAVITGLSGSGKSSLAFDTIYAEGQRRYVESLSAYARQFLDQMERPDVDSIEGLSPAIAIEQK